MTPAQEARIIITRLSIIGFTVAMIARPDWRGAVWGTVAPAARTAWGATPWGKPAPPPAPAAPVSVPPPPQETDSREPATADLGGSDGGNVHARETTGTSGEASPAVVTEEPPSTASETPAAEAGDTGSPAGNLPLRLPPAPPARILPASLRALKSAADAGPNAFRLRQLADAAAAAGFPELAAEAYLKEAAIYRREGDGNAATVEELKAGRYRTEARLFLHDPDASPPSTPRARLEPEYGVLLGAFIDRDDRLSTVFQDENWQTHRDPDEFAELTGKKHASLFCYLGYGRPFPTRWADRLKEAGVIPHLAWEPKDLASVRDDAYLSRFADAVSAHGGPVFIRFAGEMNGKWTRYHGNPALYREKFRLVSRIIRRRAPNAAMIWCVNNFPDSEIEPYYPGDDAVDWVGVNFYNVLFSDNEKSRPADHLHPADLFKTVYARYSARKPIAICEYAASHQADVDPTPRPDFAIRRMSELYAALPRLFPRVKLINWFDCNNMRHARPDRQLNNYSLSDDPQILAAYRKAISPDYFLSTPTTAPQTVVRPFASRDPVRRRVGISAWVRGPAARPRVYLLDGDRVFFASDEPGAPTAHWDPQVSAATPRVLRLIVTDDVGRRLADTRYPVRAEPGGAEPSR